MNNVITFPRHLPWKRHCFPPLLTVRADTYLRDLDACIEAQRKAMVAEAKMRQYSQHSEIHASLLAQAADAHNTLKRIRNHV